MSSNGLTMSLPDCSLYTPPCAFCYLGASTSYFGFPYNVTQTVDVTVIPLVTGLAGGGNSTYGFETITDTAYESIEAGSGNQTIFREDEMLTWELNGVALTYPTTYAFFETFRGAAAASTPSSACATRTSLSSITLPATAVNASLFYTPTSGTDASTELALGVLPTSLLDYLGELSEVIDQLGGNEPASCSATTRPSVSDFVCTTTTAVESCVTTFTDASGSESSTCTTLVEATTITIVPSETENPGGPPPTDKVPAAALRRVPGPAKFAPYTPPPEVAAPTPSPAQPQIEGPGNPTAPVETQPASPESPSSVQPTPPDNNTPPVGESTPGPDNEPSNPIDETPQNAVPDTDTSAPEGDAPPPDNQNVPAPSSDSSPESPEDGTLPPEDEDPPVEGDSLPLTITEEPPEDQEQTPEGQETNGTAPPSEVAPDGASSTGDEASNDDSSGSVPPLTTSLPGPDGTESSGSAATPGTGTTGAGDYIVSGLGSSQSRTLTSIGPSGTSVVIEPYRGSASKRLGISYGIAFLAMMMCVTLL